MAKMERKELKMIAGTVSNFFFKYLINFIPFIAKIGAGQKKYGSVFCSFWDSQVVAVLPVIKHGFQKWYRILDKI